MNSFDWLLIAVLAYSAITAFMRGLVRELFTLGGLVIGILLASWYHSWLAIRLDRFIPAPAGDVVAFLAITTGVMVIAAILGKLVQSTANAIGLGFFDRMGGAGFGLVRGGLLGVAILMAAAAFVPQSTWVRNSQLAPYFLAGAHAVSFVVPNHLRQQIQEGASAIKHKEPDWIKPHS